LLAGRHQHGAAALERRLVVADPDLGLAVEDGEHLLDGVEMGRGAAALLAPLLEDAELRRAGERGGEHAGHDAVAPGLAALALMVDDAHGFILSCRSAPCALSTCRDRPCAARHRGAAPRLCPRARRGPSAG